MPDVSAERRLAMYDAVADAYERSETKAAVDVFLAAIVALTPHSD